jgi:molecular chaperone Hsp33
MNKGFYEPPMSGFDNTDRVMRAMTDDASFRVMAASTTQTVTEIVRLQNPSPLDVEHLAGLLTGTILVRETMSPTLRVQGIVRGQGNRGTLVADSHPDGTTRGLYSLPEGKDSVSWGEDSVLVMMRTLPNGKLHQGMVSLNSISGISEALMTYMHDSEQIKSMIDVACLVEDGKIVASGGYIVQLLPELSDARLAIMTERLSDFPSVASLLREGSGPEDFLERLLQDMPFTQLGNSPLKFECKCSHLRVVSSLATLAREELNSLVANGENLDVSCDFCGKSYVISPEHVRGLLEES